MPEWLTSLVLRISRVVRRDRLEQDLRDELAFHLAMREGQLRERGAAEPATNARRRFGSTARIREELHDAWAVAPRTSGLLQDFRYAARTLRRNRGFATVVVLTLGFGIAINTATFSIVNAVLIRPLGFPDPDRLVMLRERLSGFDFEGEPFSPPDFLDVERDQRSFEGIAAYANVSLEISGQGDPARIDAARVSGGLFSVLGVPPLLGRALMAGDDRPGEDVAVLSWGLWQRRFGGDPTLVGRAVILDRRPHTVVGIMPAAFEFPRRGPQMHNRPADVWVPIAFTDRQRENRGNEFFYSVVGRLRPGVTLDAARAELDALEQQVNDRYPALLRNRGFSIELFAAPLRDEITGRTERPLLLLLAAVGMVLLVTCANVANLVLSRAAARSREIALRAALGSSRARLLQLLLTEAAMLAAAGGLVGVAASALIVAAMPAPIVETLPATSAISIDHRVLAFSAGITIATALLFALIPLVTVERGVPGRALQEEGSRATPGVRRHRLQAALVVSTVVLAFVLLVGAGLFIRSFTALMATESGFNPDGILTAAVTLPRAGYDTAAHVRSFHDALLTRASSLATVRSAALVTDLPLERYERRTLTLEGGDPASQAPRNANLSWVYGPYFETLGIRLERGRFFSSVESVEPRFVVVVNERLATVYWPGDDPIGKRLRWGLDSPQNPNPWLTVVGVVADVADGPLGTEPYLHAYEPFSQFPDVVLDNFPGSFGRHVKLAVRTEAEPGALAPLIRREIAAIDRDLAIESIATMHDRVGDIAAPRRFSAVALGGFAAGSLLLAAVGLYGLLAFSVAERRREIAVRLALGAAPAAILRMVVGHGLRLVSIGLLVGLAAAFGVARAVASLLYQTESYDVVTFGTAPMVLLLIALMACAIPAYRASRVASLTALRAE